ncbi:MAG TPA: hypothetical protein ENK54_06890 [Thiotrichales bacterium]|nr:hypothetical protein [Thiotrichales bacterium]
MNVSRKTESWPEPTVDEPPFVELEQMILYDGEATATDGCSVEPDGVCPHGHPSWPRYLGFL